MTRHQCGISALVSLRGETSGGVAKCRLSSQAKLGTSRNATLEARIMMCNDAKVRWLLTSTVWTHLLTRWERGKKSPLWSFIRVSFLPGYLPWLGWTLVHRSSGCTKSIIIQSINQSTIQQKLISRWGVGKHTLQTVRASTKFNKHKKWRSNTWLVTSLFTADHYSYWSEDGWDEIVTLLLRLESLLK